MHQKRNVADGGHNKREQGSQEHETREGRRHDKTGSDEVIALKVLRQRPPRALVGLGEVEGVEGESIDGLPRSVGK